MAAYCAAVELPFIPEALTWEPGERPEWRRSARWHVDVSASSGFEQRERRYTHTVESSDELARVPRPITCRSTSSSTRSDSTSRRGSQWARDRRRLRIGTSGDSTRTRGRGISTRVGHTDLPSSHGREGRGRVNFVVFLPWVLRPERNPTGQSETFNQANPRTADR